MTKNDMSAEIGVAEMRLAQAKLSHASGKLENTADLRQFRRGLARLLTAARAEEIRVGSQRGHLSRATVSRVADAGSGDSSSKSVFLKGVVDKLAGT